MAKLDLTVFARAAEGVSFWGGMCDAVYEVAPNNGASYYNRLARAYKPRGARAGDFWAGSASKRNHERRRAALRALARDDKAAIAKYRAEFAALNKKGR